MKRVILTPAILPPAALAELKQWLGITVSGDDTALTHFLAAALETCEAFTGALPLEAECEEALAACGGWHRLTTRPIMVIASVALVAPDGIRTALAPDQWQADLGADGSGSVRAGFHPQAVRLAVRFTAGLAPDWDALPQTLRHGIVRLAAHLHRERDAGAEPTSPPASIAALWRPWRRMRLA